MARLGFEYRKPKTLPRVADVAKQAEFIAMYENMLNSLADDEAVYFAPSRRFQANTCQAMDALHPEYQSKPAFGWVKKGTNPTLKTTAGRARVNIHGALNLETFDTPFVAPSTVGGVSAVQLLAKIEDRNQDKRIIQVIWDNAAYHKRPDVRAFLSRKNCRIHMIQLPPYCPHLNPIERLWAVMHQHVTHNRAYPTQKQVTGAILKFFRKTISKQWTGFRTQLTDNFRIISDQNLRVDNGPEYISGTLMAWAEKHGVRLEHIQPDKPQQNAYIERYNRTVRGEWLSQYIFETIEEAQDQATEWLWTYNNERPNMGIGGITPAVKLKTAA